MAVKLEHLRTFVAVAEAGSLVDAGERVGRTPSALSMTLRRLEDELGGALFEGERKSRLTPLGRHALERARRAVAEHAAALTDIGRFARGEEGVVRIVAVPSAATRLLPSVVARLGVGSAAVRVELRDTDSASVAEAVRAGGVDFGIASLPEHGGELRTEPLLEDPLRLVCAADHPLAARAGPIAWGDIDPREFIASGLCRQIASAELARLVAAAPLMVHNTTSLTAFVAGGFGVTLLPALAIADDRRFAALPLADPAAVRRLCLLFRSDETPSPLCGRVMVEVREVVGTLLNERETARGT